MKSQALRFREIRKSSSKRKRKSCYTIMPAGFQGVNVRFYASSEVKICHTKF